MRGRPKVGADFSLLAAAVNLARLAVLGGLLHPRRGVERGLSRRHLRLGVTPAA